MKKTILIGLLLSTAMLLIAPTIPAQQYLQVQSSIEQHIKDTTTGIIVNADMNEPQPLFLRFILSTILSLFLAILGTLFGVVFGPIIVFLIKVLTAPAMLIAKIISAILGGTIIQTS